MRRIIGVNDESPSSVAVLVRMGIMPLDKADGTYDKDKARMVAQGFCERIGKDFYSTFSPMASLTSVRALFAIAVYHRLGCYHADIPNAFVRSKTETELYLRLPKGVSGFLEHDPTVSTENGWVLRMLKSLYGLKDAGALFNKELDRFFVEEGYTRGVSETSHVGKEAFRTGDLPILC